jgi:hypothetical protein
MKNLTNGQVHQPYDANRKCPGRLSLALVGAVQFHQQKYAQLYKYAWLENTLSSTYAVRQ